MTDDTANIIPGHLRRFDTRPQHRHGGMQDGRERPTAVGTGQDRSNRRLDRTEARVEKVERRLDLVEG